jgi:hypothetical protein
MLSRITGNLAEVGSARPHPSIRTASSPECLATGNLRGPATSRGIHARRTHMRSRSHVDQLDADQRALLMSALPVLEELAERLPGGRR